MVRLPARRRPALVSDFQPDALAVEERAPPRVARATLYAVAALLATGVAWSCLSEIDEIASARGRLVTTVPNIVVQPLETAAIRSIAVAVGQSVKAGETLAVLDPTFSEADVQQLTARLAAAEALVRRLDAEDADRDAAFDLTRPNRPWRPASPGSAGRCATAACAASTRNWPGPNRASPATAARRRCCSPASTA